MTRPNRWLAWALLVTLLALAVWVASGAPIYTALTTLELVPVELAEDDPLAGTGFYDDSAEVVRERGGFRLGLLPSPSGPFDPHAVSVLTLLVLGWIPLAAAIARRLWRERCRGDECVSAVAPLYRLPDLDDRR